MFAAAQFDGVEPAAKSEGRAQSALTYGSFGAKMSISVSFGRRGYRPRSHVSVLAPRGFSTPACLWP